MANSTINIDVAVRIKPVNKPTDKVIFTIGNTEISKSARDVVRELLGPVLNGDTVAAPAASRAVAPVSALPAIGSKLDGGTFAGLTLADGKPAKLILLPGDEKLKWDAACEWAKKQGGELPSRLDGLVLLKNLKNEFKEEWYWTSEPYAGTASYAWIQSFNSGTQDNTHEDLDYRARAVRRVIL